MPTGGTDDTGGGEIEKPPRIPQQRPPTARQRNTIVNNVAKWLLKAGARRLLGPVGLVLDAIEVASGIDEYVPYIQSYFDEPKSLDELRQLASKPERGYDIHHIVEQTPAEQEGFPRSRIDGPKTSFAFPRSGTIRSTAGIKEKMMNSADNRPATICAARAGRNGSGWGARP